MKCIVVPNRDSENMYLMIYPNPIWVTLYALKDFKVYLVYWAHN